MISSLFLRTGALFGVAGMGLGLVMAASGDHRLATVHAHVNLIGWVGMFLAGLHHAARPRRRPFLARLHYGVALAGVTTLGPGIAGIHLGYVWGPVVAAIGSATTFAATALFAVIVFRDTRPSGNESVSPAPSGALPVVP